MFNHNTIVFALTLTFDALTAAPWLNRRTTRSVQEEGEDDQKVELIPLIRLPQLHFDSSEKIRKREVKFHIRKVDKPLSLIHHR